RRLIERAWSCTSLVLVWIAEPEITDEVVEVRSREIELARGLGDVPVVAIERDAHEALLELARRLPQRLRLGVGLARREHVPLLQRLRLRAVRADHRGLDRARELPRVARPRVVPARDERAARDGDRREPVPLADLRHEVLDELGDVVAPGVEARHLDRP